MVLCFLQNPRVNLTPGSVRNPVAHSLIVLAVGFGGYLLVGIVLTIDFGDCLQVGVVQMIV